MWGNSGRDSGRMDAYHSVIFVLSSCSFFRASVWRRCLVLPSFLCLQLGMVNEFDLVGRPFLWGSTPCIRSVCLNDHSDGRKILVGTSCSEVCTYVCMYVLVQHAIHRPINCSKYPVFKFRVGMSWSGIHMYVHIHDTRLGPWG